MGYDFVPRIFLGLAMLISYNDQAMAFKSPRGSQYFGGDPNQPTIAATDGFNTNVFYENFQSLNSIDINTSLMKGFKWYTTFGTNSVAATPACCTIDADGLVFTGTRQTVNGGGTRGNDLVSAGGNGAARGPGWALSPTGGYLEVQMAYSPVYPLGHPWAPAFWFSDMANSMSSSSGLSCANTGYNIEVDIMEAIPNDYNNPNAGVNVQTNVHENLGCNGFDSGGHFPGSMPAFNDGLMHTYALEWKTQAQNGGTGFLKFYADGVLKSTLNYSASTTGTGGNRVGAYTSIESAPLGFQVDIASGTNWTVHYGKVTIWQ